MTMVLEIPNVVFTLGGSADQVLARRLLRVGEAAKMIGRYSHNTLNRMVCEGDLPVVVMPSAVQGRESLRRTFRIPIGWVDRWIEMHDRTRPIYTERSEVCGKAGEPLYCTAAESAAACAVSERTVQDLIRLGRWAPVIRPRGGDPTIRVAALDDWVFGLIQAAEREWFGVNQEAVSA